jgi:hypothetical protein
LIDFGILLEVDVHLWFCPFFCLDAKEAKNQGQSDRSARLSRPAPPKPCADLQGF